jgi:hypothetical protein
MMIMINQLSRNVCLHLPGILKNLCAIFIPDSLLRQFLSENFSLKPEWFFMYLVFHSAQYLMTILVLLHARILEDQRRCARLLTADTKGRSGMKSGILLTLLMFLNVIWVKNV